MKRIFLLLCVISIPLLSQAQCGPAANLQAVVGVNSVALSWDAVPGATEYVVQFKYPAYGWDNIEYQQTVTSNSLNLTDVLLSVSVDWRVVTVCSGTTGLIAYGPATLAFPCPEPTGLLATNIGTTNATLSWTHHPAALPDYQAAIVAYRPAGSNASWIPLGQATNSTYTINGLQPGTSYEWCVNQICAYFYSSPAVATFTTQAAPCGVASLWLASNIGTTQANVSWAAVPGAISYTVEYKAASASSWTVAQATTTLLNATLTGLSASTNYQWRVKALCANANEGAYSNPGSFSTTAAPIAGCGTPTNVQITAIGNRTATATWTAVPGASAYQFQYRLISSNTWIGNTISGTTYTRTTYLMNSQYKYRVRAICGTVNGPFSTEGSFTTLNCQSVGTNTYEFIDHFGLGTIQRNSGPEPGGYVHTGLSTSIALGNNTNSFTLSAGTNGTYRNQNFAIFIDYNRNGSYDDSGERVAWGQLNNAGIYNGNINLSNNATAGNTGLRVVMAKAGSPNITGCMENFQGETEDYIVTITSAGAKLHATPIEQGENIRAFITASPNPSKGELQIETNGMEAQKLQIINYSGRPIYERNEITSQPIFVDIQSQPAGLYFIQILDKKGRQFQQKIIKQ